jgi:hypothetical protein
MKILKNLGKRIGLKYKITSETYYLDVDSCPLTVWRKCFENGYSAIRKDKNYGDEESDYEAYNRLYVTFGERIGVGEEFQSYIDNMKAFVLASADYVKSRKTIDGVEIHDRTKLKKVRVLLAKLQKFEKDGDERVSIAKILNRLAKMQGVGTIKESDLTVLAYFELIKDYKEWVKVS